MIFDNKAQLYADSVADVSAVCEAIGSSQGGYHDLAKANTHDGKKWIAVPYCIIGAMIAYRKSWFDEIGVTQVPGDLGGVPGSREEAQGQRPSTRTDPRPHGRRRTRLRLPLLVVMGWPRGRGRRQDGQAQLERDNRVGEVHDCLLEGGSRRGRPCLGQFEQQPRLPVGHDQRHAERRIHLHRSPCASPTSTRPTRASR